jgi:NAD(P)-dependent dehydrogenase (short-subunit alcohol dehydrogenase family)
VSALLITGAASGIGRAVALAAAARWKKPLALVDRDKEGLENLIAELAGAMPAVTIAGDLADVEFIAHTVSHTVDVLGGLCAVVSNAGIVGSSMLSDLSLEDFEREMAVNFRATWLLAKSAYPHLRSGGGALVATASMAAAIPAPGLGVYTPSKAALSALIRQMAIEWAGDGIRCNCVSPGPTRTGITVQAYEDPEALARRELAVPLGRVGEASDIAEVILFLISDASRFITGADIVVDGGLSLNLMRLGGAATGLSDRGAQT